MKAATPPTAAAPCPSSRRPRFPVPRRRHRCSPHPPCCRRAHSYRSFRAPMAGAAPCKQAARTRPGEGRRGRGRGSRCQWTHRSRTSRARAPRRTGAGTRRTASHGTRHASPSRPRVIKANQGSSRSIKGHQGQSASPSRPRGSRGGHVDRVSKARQGPSRATSRENAPGPQKWPSSRSS